jgi:hypothetical protein
MGNLSRRETKQDQVLDGDEIMAHLLWLEFVSRLYN